MAEFQTIGIVLTEKRTGGTPHSIIAEVNSLKVLNIQMHFFTKII